MDEAAKRRELQLMLLREGYSQDDAREMAAGLVIERLDEQLEKMREHAMRFPERQIVPIGTVDLYDVKSQREQTIGDAEEVEYFENRNRLTALMTQSFSLTEMPTAVLQALIEALEANGVERLDAMTDISKTIDFLRKITEYERQHSNTEESEIASLCSIFKPIGSSVLKLEMLHRRAI